MQNIEPWDLVQPLLLVLQRLVVEVLDGAGLGVPQAGAGQSTVRTWKIFHHQLASINPFFIMLLREGIF